MKRILNRRVTQALNTLNVKGSDYDSPSRKFDNFESGAEILEYMTAMKTDRVSVLFGYLTKHLVSVKKMILSNEVYSVDYIDEKIGDAFCYGLIKCGMLEDTEDYANLDVIKELFNQSDEDLEDLDEHTPGLDLFNSLLDALIEDNELGYSLTLILIEKVLLERKKQMFILNKEGAFERMEVSNEKTTEIWFPNEEKKWELLTIVSDGETSSYYKDGVRVLERKNDVN